MNILAGVTLSQVVRPEGPAGTVQPLEVALAQSLQSKARKRSNMASSVCKELSVYSLYPTALPTTVRPCS